MEMQPLVLPFNDIEPAIDPTAWLAPNATVIGDAHIGPRASIFYGAVVRADMAAVQLGAGSNLQDNVVVHTDTGLPAVIGAGVTVGHAAVVHGCVIEDQCLIGMNATLLNGAVVGSGSLVAAGAVVREGAIIPPRSLVAGVPSRVLRPLTADEQDRVIAGSDIYVDLAARHREAGRQTPPPRSS